MRVFNHQLAPLSCNICVPIMTAGCSCSSVVPLQELHAPWRWSERGPERSGSRVRHRNRGRRRREGHRPAASALRGHDPDPDLCRGARALRPHRGPHPVHKIKRPHQPPSSSIPHQSSENQIFTYFHYTPRVWQDGMAAWQLNPR